MRAGAAGAVKTGMKMAGARLDGENVGCGWAAQDEASRANVASERQRGGRDVAAVDHDGPWH